MRKLLIANRGEIALRILRACKEQGIATVAVHSTSDAEAMHVRLADESVCIGKPPAAESYLNMINILSAAQVTGADAIHPGIGFLSERADFAERVHAQGLIFVGPAIEHLRVMGDKVAARQTAARLGLPNLPGGPLPDNDHDILALADKIGYPLLIKAVSGGGGRGIKRIDAHTQLLPMAALAAAEATAAFGDGRLYLERCVDCARHIEVQVLGDGRGHALSLGERDCSLQRRHQKLIEEAPAPDLPEELRRFVHEKSAAAAAQLGYSGLGTFEFLFDGKEVFFIEMNTRLQVEHCVSEAVIGLDLVAWQLAIAAGAPLTLRQEDITTHGHAIELRINAEHPQTFRPSPGRVTGLHFPAGLGVRVDSAAYLGCQIPPYYDSLVAKFIIHAQDRASCLRRARRALEETQITGIDTGLALHRALLESRDFCQGPVHVTWLESWLKTHAAQVEGFIQDSPEPPREES